MNMARKITQTRKTVVTAIAWSIGFLIFFPILWTILMSFKSEGDAIDHLYIYTVPHHHLPL